MEMLKTEISKIKH